MEYAFLVKVDGFESVLEGSLYTTAGAEKEGTRVSVTLKDGNRALVRLAKMPQKQHFPLSFVISNLLIGHDLRPI